VKEVVKQHWPDLLKETFWNKNLSEAAKTFSLIVLLSDGYLQLRSNVAPDDRRVRFSKLMERFPQELQMRISNIKEGENRTFVRASLLNAALPKLLDEISQDKPEVLQASSKTTPNSYPSGGVVSAILALCCNSRNSVSILINNNRRSLKPSDQSGSVIKIPDTSESTIYGSHPGI
jgi:hypothetical protein